MKREQLFRVAAAAVLCAGLVRAQLAAGRAIMNDDSPLDVTAERHLIDRDTGVWTCDGNVRVGNSQHTLRADHVRVNSKTGEVEAKGNVELIQPGVARWVGESIAYNFKTGAGLAGKSMLQAGRMSIRAEKTRREPDGSLSLWNVEATTCTNAPGHQHYVVSGGRMTFVDGEYLSARGGVVWLSGLPVAYWPYWYYNLDDRSGLNLRPGYTSDWGPFLLGFYDFPLVASPGGTLDGRVRLDYRALRGWAAGGGLEWKSKAFGAGKLEYYHADDREGPDRTPPFVLPSEPIESRSRVAVAHAADLTERDRVVARGQVVSDEALLRDFFPSQNRQSVQPDNVAAYTRREDTLAAGVTASGPLNGFYDGVSRAPEAWLNIMPQELLAGIYYESQTRAGYLLRQSEPRLLLRGEEYDTLRVDTAHRLSLPLTIGDAWRVTPRAGYRGTFYRDAWVEDGGQVRNLFELGVETALKARGTFGDLRHTVEPYADYSYIPRPKDLGDGEVYTFDRYDSAREWRDQFGFDGLSAPREWNGVRAGVRNTVQQVSENGPRTFLAADVYGALALADGSEPAGWQLAGLDLSYRPIREVRLDVDGEYDVREHELRRADARVQWTAEKWRFSAGYLQRCEPPNPLTDRPIRRPYDRWLAADDRSGAFVTEAQRALNSIWTVGFHTRSDLREGQLQEIGGHIQYNLDCMVYQLRAAYKPAATLDWGREQKADFKIALMVWLVSGRGDPNRDDILGW